MRFVKCDLCEGIGYIRETNQGGYQWEWYSILKKCETCDGQGWLFIEEEGDYTFTEIS